LADVFRQDLVGVGKPISVFMETPMDYLIDWGNGIRGINPLRKLVMDLDVVSDYGIQTGVDQCIQMMEVDDLP